MVCEIAAYQVPDICACGAEAYRVLPSPSRDCPSRRTPALRTWGRGSLMDGARRLHAASVRVRRRSAALRWDVALYGFLRCVPRRDGFRLLLP